MTFKPHFVVLGCGCYKPSWKQQNFVILIRAIYVTWKKWHSSHSGTVEPLTGKQVIGAYRPKRGALSRDRGHSGLSVIGRCKLYQVVDSQKRNLKFVLGWNWSQNTSPAVAQNVTLKVLMWLNFLFTWSGVNVVLVWKSKIKILIIFFLSRFK